MPEAEGIAAIEAEASVVRNEMKAAAGIGPADAVTKAGTARWPIKAAPIAKTAKARTTTAWRVMGLVQETNVIVAGLSHLAGHRAI